MKTDSLIDRIALDPAPASFTTFRIWVVVLAAILLCSAIFLGVAGTRPALGARILSPVVAAKTLLPLATLFISLRAALLTARPGRDIRPALSILALPLAAAVFLWLRAFMILPDDQRFADVGAFSLSECVGLISLLSLGPAVVTITILRDGATVTPWLSAFLGGLAASSGAAAGYSLFCIQDNPLFFVTWYSFAILLAASLTAVSGSRFLRW